MATVFSVRASAGKGSFSASLVSVDPLVIRAGIPAQPEKGQANRALLSGLEKMLNCSVIILSGHAGRKKALAADCTRDEFVLKMNESGKKK
jgi:uncharacterized protein YggU (UPF0235/DUF167 family)